MEIHSCSRWFTLEPNNVLIYYHYPYFALAFLFFSFYFILDLFLLFWGAALTALQKKEGGVWPIAVGLTLQRSVAKVAGSQVME